MSVFSRWLIIQVQFPYCRFRTTDPSDPRKVLPIQLFTVMAADYNGDNLLLQIAVHALPVEGSQ